jgi:hypothetical protein
MSKWISETLQLESKSQLKEHRRHRLNALLMHADLNLLFYSFWSQADKDLETVLWKQADADYESRKTTLKGQLKAINANDLKKYFQEIGIVESNVDDWLGASPHP